MVNFPVQVDENVVAANNARLFVFAEARSGSNWLVETLDSHDDIAILKEIMQPGQRMDFYQKGDDRAHCSDNDIQYVEKQLSTLKGSLKGCKILFPQAIRFMDLYQFIFNYKNAKYILLSRQNPVKGEVSGFIARSFSTWHVESGPVKRQISVDPSLLYQRVVWRELATSFTSSLIRVHCPNVVSICYEELFTGNSEALAKLFDFLQIDGSKIIRSKEVKSNSSALPDILLNYQEIKQYFLDKQYMVSMFD